ncbi:hypothetical protein [Pseudoduganella chitinolytica]|uniref:Scaffolding protein n=1 Tax=Pseudoduganella chitinolytica TaxID=34070 RepID=A0ABY8BJL0_9BURK|nr:hypothetical protein [Pseudoduganella chitinolytica]WEF34867.1 hypothetical protein PX653_08925 [Pseudoduganella chitinolytica]
MHPKYYMSGRKPVFHKPYEGESGGGGALDADAAATAMAALDEPAPAAESAAPPAAEVAQPEADEADGGEQPDDDGQDDGAITVEVDGKAVQLTKEQIAEAYKNAQQSADSARATSEATEARKQADAEAQKAREARDTYAQKLATDTAAEQRILQDAAAQLTDELLESDPVAYMKLQRTLDARYAKLQQDQAELQQITHARQQEHEQAVKTYQVEQKKLLLDKLPHWKDEAKAKAEVGQIKAFLEAEGFTAEEVGQFGDHRLVLLARKAMQLDQITSKAKQATEKIAGLPPKVERPGNKNVRPTDGRTVAMKRLSSSGSIDDAAAALSLL